MNINGLGEKLSSLRGYDFELVEREERAANNMFPDLTFSKSFQARLAARALAVPYDDIKNLPIKDYNKICRVVFNFFFSSSDDENVSEK